jgi:hypothetical protein
MSAWHREGEMMEQGKSVSKRKWKEPALVVLVRNRPEESVLVGCKSNEVSVDTSSNGLYLGCHTNEECWSDCYNVFTTS